MNMQEFLARVTSDKALVEKLSKAAAPEEAYDVAKEAGLTDSFENFMDTMKKLNEAAGEMSDAEINAVTGGEDDHETVSEIVTYVCAFSAV